jgi:hypothetical protein
VVFSLEVILPRWNDDPEEVAEGEPDDDRSAVVDQSVRDTVRPVRFAAAFVTRHLPRRDAAIVK